MESITRCNNDKVRLPDSLGLQKVGAQMEVVGNRFVVEGETSATFANDLQSSLLSSQVGFDGSRVMVLTTPNAQGWVCSYFIENDIVEIAYPHTTSCHRGSGYIVRLHRQSIGKNEPK